MEPIDTTRFVDPSFAASLARTLITSASATRRAQALASLALVSSHALLAADLSATERTSLLARLLDEARSGHAVASCAVITLGSLGPAARSAAETLTELRALNASDTSEASYGQGGVEHDPTWMVRLIDEALSKIALHSRR